MHQFAKQNRQQLVVRLVDLGVTQPHGLALRRQRRRHGLQRPPQAMVNGPGHAPGAAYCVLRAVTALIGNGINDPEENVCLNRLCDSDCQRLNSEHR